MANTFSVVKGQVYGEWSVVGDPVGQGANQSARVPCQCSCGVERMVMAVKLRAGLSKSCGHITQERRKKTSIAHTTHGHSKRTEYTIWSGIKGRCFNPKNPVYQYYGGRGIIVCERWRFSFENFFEDMGQRPSLDFSLDRIDPNGNYEPGNCRWATMKEQQNNKRRSGPRRRAATFQLIRDVDVSGVSGIGAVAEGVVFHDGQVALSWYGPFHTTELLPNIGAVHAVHGHNGNTRVVWDAL